MSDLNTLITEHWNAKAALDAAQQREKAAREALSSFLCKDEGSLKNKTLNLSGGYKLKHEVSRTIKIDKSHEGYRQLPTLLNTEELNNFVKTKSVTEFSYSGYRSLPDEAKSKLTGFVSVNEAVAIKYETATDNR